MNNELARYNMIEQQIRPWDTLDHGVLELLATVRREDFVPAAYRPLAFADIAIPLGHGRSMLEPRIEARLMQALKVQRHERVLEIGCGSGFMAALLGHRAQSVVTLETDADLAASASAALGRAGLSNVAVRVVAPEACAAGLPSEAPFDVILLSGSVPEVPRALLEQLKVGGRLAAIVGHDPIMRARVFTRVGDAAWSQADAFDTLAPRLAGFDAPERFHF